jgi:hypothetical protein
MLLLLAVGGTGCAQAHQDVSLGGRPDGGGIVVHDSNGGGGDDAPIIDAPGHPIDGPAGTQQITLSQTNNMTVAPGLAVACGNTSGTADNSWYRVFRLSDYGVTSTLHVTQVSFMVDYADSLAGSQTGTVKIGTYAGTVDGTSLNTAQITTIGSVPVTIPNGDSMVAVPPAVIGAAAVDVPANANLIVELDMPDGEAAGDFFYIGVSSGGEMHPGYIRSSVSACGATTPASLVSIGHADNAVMLTVSGNY